MKNTILRLKYEYKFILGWSTQLHRRLQNKAVINQNILRIKLLSSFILVYIKLEV